MERICLRSRTIKKSMNFLHIDVYFDPVKFSHIIYDLKLTQLSYFSGSVAAGLSITMIAWEDIIKV